MMSVSSPLRSWLVPFSMTAAMAVIVCLCFMTSVFAFLGADAFSSVAYDPHQNCLYSGKVYPAGATIMGPGHFPLTCGKSPRAVQQDQMLTWEQ